MPAAFLRGPPHLLEEADQAGGRVDLVGEHAGARPKAGVAWWKLCQFSPSDTTASAATLVLRSPVANGRRPQM